MTKVQLGAFLRERHPSWTFYFFIFLRRNMMHFSLMLQGY